MPRPTAPHASVSLIWPALLAALFVTVGAPASADEKVTLGPSKDNTIYADGDLSNGAGDLFAGVTSRSQIRRALLAFDIAGNVPAGSTVTSVQLTLEVNKTNFGAGTQPCTIHRLLADWGEGTSVGTGGGAPATTGDATWTYRFFNTERWSSLGGDFVAAASATQDVGESDQSYTWGSTPQMVADVQAWLVAPAANFGWLVQGNETTAPTTKRFTSREGDPALRPKLVVQFTSSDMPTPTPTPTEMTATPSPTPPCIGDCNGTGTVKINDIIILINIVLSNAPPPACPQGLPSGSPVDMTLIIKAVNNALGRCFGS
jgi:hypothetical protein